MSKETLKDLKKAEQSLKKQQEKIEEKRKKILVKQGKGFFLVEHDMNFISSVCEIVYVLDTGEKIAEGTPEQIQKDERVLEVYLGGRRTEKENKNGVPEK